MAPPPAGGRPCSTPSQQHLQGAAPVESTQGAATRLGLPAVLTPPVKSNRTPTRSPNPSSSWVAHLWELLYADQEVPYMPALSCLKQQLTDAAGGRPWEASAAERLGRLAPAAFLAMLKQAVQPSPAVEEPGHAGEGGEGWDEAEQEEWWQQEEEEQWQRQLGQSEANVAPAQGDNMQHDPVSLAVPAAEAGAVTDPGASALQPEAAAAPEHTELRPISASPSAGATPPPPPPPAPTSLPVALTAGQAVNDHASPVTAAGTGDEEAAPACALDTAAEGAASTPTASTAAAAAGVSDTVAVAQAGTAATATGKAAQRLPPAAAPAAAAAAITAVMPLVSTAAPAAPMAAASGVTCTRQDLLLLRAALGQLLQVAATALQGPVERLLRAGLCFKGGCSPAVTGAVVLPAAAWKPSKEAADALQVGGGCGCAQSRHKRQLGARGAKGQSLCNTHTRALVRTDMDSRLAHNAGPRPQACSAQQPDN
jgi:hypothetical protein